MIDQHVTSLDLSRQLWEAGIKVESEFWWQGHLHSGNRVELVRKIELDKDSDCLPAPLSSELLGLLLTGDDNHIAMEKRLSNFKEVFYRSYRDSEGRWLHVSDDKSLQDSLAKTILYEHQEGRL